MTQTRLNMDRKYLVKPPREFSAEWASKLQTRLRRLVRRRSNSLGDVRVVAGLDSSYRGGLAFGAAVTVDLETMATKECASATMEIAFPYVPGLLAFREAPVLLAAVKKLKNPPDIYLVDGHGYAHPRRFGLACHIGIALNASTIGIAKGRLCGTISGTRLKDRGETIGAVMPRTPGKPLYISVGHKISLRNAVRIVAQCFRIGVRNPICLAHMEANRAREALAQ